MRCTRGREILSVNKDHLDSWPLQWSSVQGIPLECWRWKVKFQLGHNNNDFISMLNMLNRAEQCQ